jgi:multimeric flavodoxin WrbA
MLRQKTELKSRKHERFRVSKEFLTNNRLNKLAVVEDIIMNALVINCSPVRDGATADIVVSVSPSYWADIPGQFKVFIDRCTPWCNTHEPHAKLSG